MPGGKTRRGRPGCSSRGTRTPKALSSRVPFACPSGTDQHWTPLAPNLFPSLDPWRFPRAGAGRGRSPLPDGPGSRLGPGAPGSEVRSTCLRQPGSRRGSARPPRCHLKHQPRPVPCAPGSQAALALEPPALGSVPRPLQANLGAPGAHPGTHQTGPPGRAGRSLRGRARTHNPARPGRAASRPATTARHSKGSWFPSLCPWSPQAALLVLTPPEITPRAHRTPRMENATAASPPLPD